MIENISCQLENTLIFAALGAMGGALFALIIAFKNIAFKKGDISDKWFVVSCAAFACLFGFVGFAGIPNNTTAVDTPIYTLGDSYGVTGRFVLGSGYVSSSPVYIYYYKTDDGGYALDHARANMATIYQDENEKPYIRKIRQPCGDTTYKIHVPVGSIVEGYKLGSE